jgi:hypothetical protein
MCYLPVRLNVTCAMGLQGAYVDAEGRIIASLEPLLQ